MPEVSLRRRASSHRAFAPAAVLALAAAAFGAALPASLAAQGGSRRDPEDFVLALGLIRRGLHDEAAQKLESYLREHPNHRRVAEGWYRLGTCRLAANPSDPRPAVEPLRNALAKGGDDFRLRPECRYRLGTSLQALEEFGDARDQLSALLGETPGDHYLRPASSYALGECLAALGDDDGALAQFVAAAQTDGELAFSGAYQAGFVLLRLGRNDDARKMFAGLADAYPRHEAIGEIRYLEGEAAYRDGAWEAAANAWRQGRRHGGEFADDVLHGLAWCEVKLGQPDRALATFRQVLENHGEGPLASKARLEVGRLLQGRGDHREAVQALAPLLEGDDVDGELARQARELTGLAQLELGDGDAAEAAFRAAMSGNAAEDGDASLPARMQFHLGEALAEQAQWERALTSYDAALAAAPDRELRGDVLYSKALALHKLERFGDSQQVAQALIDADGTHRLVPLARFAVAENLFSSERYDDAFARYEALGDDHPNVRQARFKAAWCCYLGGRGADAAPRFERIAADDEQPAAVREEALSLAVLAWHEAQQADRALAAADRYRARHPQGQYLARTERIAGRVLRARGDLRGAAARLASAATNDRSEASAGGAQLEAADVLFERGDFEGAKQVYGSLLEREDRVGARAHEGFAWCAFELGDEQACLAAVRAGLRHPSCADEAAGLLELETTVHHRAERWDDARDSATKFLAEFKDHERAGELRYALGLAQARGGDLTNARLTLTRLAATPDAVERADRVLYELAWVCRKLDDDAGTQTCFTRLIEISEDRDLVGEARVHLAEFAIASDDVAAARGQLEQVRDGAHRGRAQYRLGSTWLDENPQRAAQCFERVVALGAEHALHDEARFMAGEAWMRAKNFEKADPPLAGLLRDAGDHERAQRARLYLGECRVRGGRSADAIAQLTEFLRRGDDESPVAQARARVWRGRAYQQRDQHDEAEADFATATDLTEGDLAAEAQYRIGEVRRARDDLPGAIDAFVKLSILYEHEPWVPRGLLDAATCYRERNQPEKARKFLSELVERYPNTDAAKAARNQLKDL